MRHFRLLFATLLLIGITGCLGAWLNHLAPETVAEAKSQFDFLRDGQFDRFAAALDPSIDRQTLREKLTAMTALIPAGNPESVKTVGAWSECDTRTGCDTEVTLEYQFPGKWVLVQMTLHRVNEKSTITAFHIQRLGDSLEHFNRFTLIGKTPLQYAILLMTLVALAVTLYALVLCIRTPMARRKWLWIIFILIGFGRVDMNWTTGEVSHKTFHVLLLSSGTFGQPYGPWIFMVGIPLGAILFLIFRDRLRKPANLESPEQTAPPEAETV